MLNLIRLGKRIAELRERIGMNQETLANDLGIARTALSRLENGQRDISYDEMRRLSIILGIDPEELIQADDFEDEYALFRKTRPEQNIDDLEKAQEIVEAMLGYEYLYRRFELGEHK